MGIRGIAIGGALGSFFGPVGAILGAVLGDRMEKELAGRPGPSPRRAVRSGGASGPLARAYAVLGVSPRASDGEVKRAYREMAKKYHPDALNARGEDAKAASGMMAKINAAWVEIEKARHLR